MALRSIRNLDYVVLLCRDLAAMRAFYEGVLGLPAHRELPGWIELRVGASLLTLRPRGRDYDGPGADGSASVQLAFRVTPAEVDACHTALLQAGIEILEPPTTQAWGHRTVFFRDPEANVLEIYADV